MSKRFTSLVVAAALVGSVAAVSLPATASAGTVAVKGDTAVTYVWFYKLYGRLDQKNGRHKCRIYKHAR